MIQHKLLVIDDDKDLCKLIKKLLESEGFSVTLRYDGVSGLNETYVSDYKLIILDIMLPNKNGFDVLADIRKNNNVPVLMLTAKDSEGDKVSGLRMGADDYIIKPFINSEFIARVHSLIRRYTVLNPSCENKKVVIDDGKLHIDSEKRIVLINDKEIDLTAKEFGLIYFLAQNKGKVFTKKQIYSSVWNDEYAFDDNNIMVHIRRLRKKIEPIPEQPIYILTVWGVGYKFGGD